MNPISPAIAIAFAALVFGDSATAFQTRQQPASQSVGAGADSAVALIVMVKGQLGGAETFGAGIIFGREANRVYIVTANHVVRRGDPPRLAHVQVLLKPLPAKWLDASVLPHADPSPPGLDLAVLAIDGLEQHGLSACDLPFGELARPDTLRRGASVYPVGYPQGAPWGMPVTAGRVAQISGDLITFESAFVRAGHSGGALVLRPPDPVL